MIVWDAGTWSPLKDDEAADPQRAVRDGELHVDLTGEKLRGQFVLVRTSVDGDGKETWLLLHKRDDAAVPGWDPEDHPASVLTGRTNEEVAADPDRLWRSDLPASHASIALRAAAVAPVGDDALAALDSFGATGTWHVFGRDVRVTNLDKLLFPGRGREQPVTKRDLLRYAAQIAPVVAPYLARRRAEPASLPERSRWQGVLAPRGPRARSGLVAAVGQQRCRRG